MHGSLTKVMSNLVSVHSNIWLCFKDHQRNETCWIEPQNPTVTVQTYTPKTSEDPALEILRKVFNHDQFKGIQREVVKSLLEDKDTLAIIPTGGGKTVCFWIIG